MRYLTGYVDSLQTLLADAMVQLAAGSFEYAIQSAVSHYSRINPLRRAVDLLGDGSTYTFELPSNFLATSIISKIEYPYGNQIPTYLGAGDYVVYHDLDESDNDVIRLRTYDTPAYGYTLRVYYTTDHVLTDDTDTIPDRHFSPVVHLSAHYLCMALSGHYAATTDDSLRTAVVVYHSKKEQFETLAMRYMDMFRMEMGIPKNGTGVGAAGIQTQLPRADSIFH